MDFLSQERRTQIVQFYLWMEPRRCKLCRRLAKAGTDRCIRHLEKPRAP